MPVQGWPSVGCAEGVNFLRVTGTQRLMRTVDGCYEERRTQGLEGDEVISIELKVLGCGKSCGVMNFSESVMTVLPHVLWPRG